MNYGPILLLITVAALAACGGSGGGATDVAGAPSAIALGAELEPKEGDAATNVPEMTELKAEDQPQATTP